MPYIYSTATSSTEYRFYRKGGGDVPVPDGGIVIAGGANVTNKNFLTPYGIVTKVTEEELKKLQDHPSFQKHLKRGFLSVRNDQVDEEVAVADMEKRDASAPLVDQDFEEGKAPAGTATKVKKKG